MNLASWWPFEAIVALRFLREGKVQTLLSGLQFNFINRVLTGQAHIQLMPHKETVRALRRSETGEVQAVITQAPLQRLKSFDQWQQVQTMVRQLPEVLVVSPAASGTSIALTVAGISDLGNKGANARSVFVSLRTAQSLLGLIGGVTLLDITVKDVYAAEVIAQQLHALSGLQADSWIKSNEQFFTAVNAQSTANTAIRFFVALSVGFGIASVLVVSVVQRSREIGILRAMGISRGQILRVFLLQGGLLGLGGALVGSALGGMSLALWQFLQRNPDGSVMFPLSMDSSLLTQAVVLATLTGLLAALAPALRAARLDPVVAIRG